MADSNVLAHASTDERNDDIRKALAAKALLGSVGAAVLGVAILEQPAQADAVADVTAQVTSLGTLAGVALAVALVPFGIFFAMKIVRKVLSGT